MIDLYFEASAPVGLEQLVTVGGKTSYEFSASAARFCPRMAAFEDEQRRQCRPLRWPHCAPRGEANWVPTGGMRPSIFRFYGPEASFWNKSFVMPDVELVRVLPPSVFWPWKA